MIRFSVLDLSPILQGSSIAQTFRNTLDLARHAERLGFHRYWLAEHHNMMAIASAATSVVIGHVAGGTNTIRVGSGGIMLPNHAPLVIAEQFGTLATLYPNRIDLGLGRAPGTDQRTAQALRRNMSNESAFPNDVIELQSYFRPAEPGQPVRAVPGAGIDVPIWLLGSSIYSAQLAAHLGLPFAFASHFALPHLTQALQLYRAHFKPSPALAKPYVMVGMNVCAADTDAQAKRLFTSVQQQWVNRIRGTPAAMPPPVDSMDGRWTEAEKISLEGNLGRTAVGSPETVGRAISAFMAETRADEIIMISQIYDQAARIHSYEVVADVRARLIEVEQRAEAS